MKSKVVFHNGYVKIHYQHLESRVRYSTGVAIKDKNYLKKDGTLKSTVVDYKKKQGVINALKKKANHIIDEYLHQYKNYPKSSTFKTLWKNYNSNIENTTLLTTYYNEFLKTKVEYFKSLNPISIKDYSSLGKNIQDYETYKGHEFQIQEITEDWLRSFFNFLMEDRKDYDVSRKKGGKYWSKYKIKKSTIDKRFRTLKEFFRWCDKNEYYAYPKFLADFKIGIRKVEEVVKAVLKTDEIKQLYNTQFNNDQLDFIKDVFVFSCYTGLRFGDLMSLTRKHIYELKGIGNCIEKKSQKTGVLFTVPLNNLAMEIVERYNCKFDRYSNANFNKHLHYLLSLTGLFDDEIEFNGEIKKRWECISIHRGRDTFCTVLINNRVPINEIMKYTGHKSIANFNKYIDRKSTIEKNYTQELL